MGVVSYIGIDPGGSGGLARYLNGHHFAIKMPETEQDIIDGLGFLRGPYGCYAMIEHVHSMPGAGVSGMFKFGMSYGGLRMALVAAGIGFERVSPVKWQRYFGLLRLNKDETIKDKKNRHKAKAQELTALPKITHAVADALLIAEYCRRHAENWS